MVVWVDEWQGHENYSDLDIGEGHNFIAEDDGDANDDGDGDGDGGDWLNHKN